MEHEQDSTNTCESWLYGCLMLPGVLGMLAAGSISVGMFTTKFLAESTKFSNEINVGAGVITGLFFAYTVLCGAGAFDRNENGD